VPTDLAALTSSGIVSRVGIARARIEPWLVRASLTRLAEEPADSVSVGALVDRRLGAEVTDRLVEPLLGGVYAGHARQLSLAAAAPQIARLVKPDRSLLRAAGAERARSGSADEVPVFAGIRGGVGRLPQAIAGSTRARIRTGATVRELRHSPDGRWSVVVGSTTDAEAIQADAVVLATPAAPTARLLAEVAAAAAIQLRRIEYASMAVVTLAYPSAVVGDRLAGSGFLVPPVDGRAVKAATFSASKWRWLGELGEQQSVTLLRASIGRHGDEQILQRDDAELVELAGGELEEAVGLRGPLVDAQVTRWGGALPQYTVGHAGRVERIRAAVTQVDRLEVCGAAYEGIGIAACVADGQRAATRVVAELRSREQ
jgi:oxygen-dependent protoporphyrinogen oxidase